MKPFFTNDAIVLGILLAVLAFVFVSSGSKASVWQRFYRIFPPLLLCYFLPALLHWPLGIIANDWFDIKLWDELRNMGLDPPAKASFSEMDRFLSQNNVPEEVSKPFKRGSGLYNVSSRYLLPASLILLCLSIDLKAVLNLGPKALIMFLTATAGIILGGPVALLVVTTAFPNLIDVSTEELWKGLSTIAGSWIGGGANQTAMREIFNVSQNLFGTMVVVDIVVANIWMAFLLYGANIRERIDKSLKADTSAIDDLIQRVRAFREGVERIPNTTDTFKMLAVAFGGVALAHWGAQLITGALAPHQEQLVAMRLESLNSSFFWIVVIATTFGLVLSFTRARNLEGVGASRWGSVFIYVLVATIGMQMDLGAVFKNLGLFAIGFVWMLTHVALLLIVAKLIRAPFFFVAVGSQANVGGAASAPVVASAFDTALAPVGVLLAVLGYALGTYGALLCAFLMKMAAGG
ncbi:MAG: DUF819 family protein [Saprospiraceae bacterium]|nr:DUF819 family protein [Saprospiraceae bacterium]